MRSISMSLSAGMIGATITEVGTPAWAKTAQGLEPPHRRRRARLHLARQFGIERRHRKRDLDQFALGHPRENVEVAQHQRRLGDDADRVAGAVSTSRMRRMTL